MTKQQCRLKGCESMVYGAFLCKKHYNRAFILNKPNIWKMLGIKYEKNES